MANECSVEPVKRAPLTRRSRISATQVRRATIDWLAVALKRRIAEGRSRSDKLEKNSAATSSNISSKRASNSTRTFSGSRKSRGRSIGFGSSTASTSIGLAGDPNRSASEERSGRLKRPRSGERAMPPGDGSRHKPVSRESGRPKDRSNGFRIKRSGKCPGTPASPRIPQRLHRTSFGRRGRQPRSNEGWRRKEKRSAGKRGSRNRGKRRFTKPRSGQHAHDARRPPCCAHHARRYGRGHRAAGRWRCTASRSNTPPDRSPNRRGAA